VTSINKDTGAAEKQIVKVPVKKTKVVPKKNPLPVAQNSTHEVVPVVEEEPKVVSKVDEVTGQEVKEVIKVPVKKMKAVPKVIAKPAPKKIEKVIDEVDEDESPEAEHEKKKMSYLEDLE